MTRTYGLGCKAQHGTIVVMDYDNPLVLKDVAAWRAWLEENEETSDGVWLLVAKKGTTEQLL